MASQFAFANPDMDSSAAKPSCATLIDEVIDIQSRRRTSDDIIIATLHDDARGFRSYHASLAARYGTTVYIPYGSFDTMLQWGANAESQARSYSSFTNELESRLSSITATMLQRCK